MTDINNNFNPYVSTPPSVQNGGKDKKGAQGADGEQPETGAPGTDYAQMNPDELFHALSVGSLSAKTQVTASRILDGLPSPEAVEKFETFLHDEFPGVDFPPEVVSDLFLNMYQRVEIAL